MSKYNPLGLTAEDFTLDNNTITAKEDLYVSHRPEDITDELEKKVDDYRDDYTMSVLHAGGLIAIDKMFNEEDEGDNTEWTLQATMPHGVASANFQKTAEGELSTVAKLTVSTDLDKVLNDLMAAPFPTE